MASVTGLQDLLDNLDLLEVSVRSGARGAVNAYAQKIKAKAVENARAQGLVSTGALVKNIAVKRERFNPPNLIEYAIGVRHGHGAKGAEKIAVRGPDGKIRMQYTNDPFYWWFWENGYNAANGRHVPARAFLFPAVRALEGQGLDIMGTYLKSRLERTQLKALR